MKSPWETDGAWLYHRRNKYIYNFVSHNVCKLLGDGRKNFPKQKNLILVCRFICQRFFCRFPFFSFMET